MIDCLILYSTLNKKHTPTVFDKMPCVRTQVGLESVWSWCGVGLELVWSRVGVGVESVKSWCGVDVESV